MLGSATEATGTAASDTNTVAAASQAAKRDREMRRFKMVTGSVPAGLAVGLAPCATPPSGGDSPRGYVGPPFPSLSREFGRGHVTTGRAVVSVQGDLGPA